MNHADASRAGDAVSTAVTFATDKINPELVSCSVVFRCPRCGFRSEWDGGDDPRSPQHAHHIVREHIRSEHTDE